jgi:hypothetical protein
MSNPSRNVSFRKKRVTMAEKPETAWLKVSIGLLSLIGTVSTATWAYREKTEAEEIKSRGNLLVEAIKSASPQVARVRLCLLSCAGIVGPKLDLHCKCDELDRPTEGSPVQPGLYVTDPAPMCQAGFQGSCACPGGHQGTQVCENDGRRWGQCDCPTIMNPVASSPHAASAPTPVRAPSPQTLKLDAPLDLGPGDQPAVLGTVEASGTYSIRVRLDSSLACSRSACNPPTGAGSDCWCNSPASASIDLIADTRSLVSVAYRDETPTGWEMTTGYRYRRSLSGFADNIPLQRGTAITLKVTSTHYVGSPPPLRIESGRIELVPVTDTRVATATNRDSTGADGRGRGQPQSGR